MGTIDDQPVRGVLDAAVIYTEARELWESIEELTRYQAVDIVMRLHQSYLDQQDRDVHDEQVAGINSTLREIVAALGGDR